MFKEIVRLSLWYKSNCVEKLYLQNVMFEVWNFVLFKKGGNHELNTFTTSATQSQHLNLIKFCYIANGIQHINTFCCVLTCVVLIRHDIALTQLKASNVVTPGILEKYNRPTTSQNQKWFLKQSFEFERFPYFQKSCTGTPTNYGILWCNCHVGAIS